MSEGEFLLEAAGLSKAFGRKPALRGLSLLDGGQALGKDVEAWRRLQQAFLDRALLLFSN